MITVVEKTCYTNTPLTQPNWQTTKAKKKIHKLTFGEAQLLIEKHSR